MTLTVPPLSGAVDWDDYETLIGTLAPTGADGPCEVVAIGPEALAWAAAAEAAQAQVAGAWRGPAASAGRWVGPVDALGGWRGVIEVEGTWR